MRIVYLLETAAEIWGGVKSVLEDANLLHDRGHQVTVLARSAAPEWMALRVRFVRVPDFSAANVPEADLVVGTFWTTVPHALAAGRGIAVHYCQGFEGDNPENQALRSRIDSVYRLPAAKVTISPHLKTLLEARFSCAARQVTYAIDHATMRPGTPRPRAGRKVRVGLVGPWQIPWKDLRTGYEACSLAHRAGLDLVLVRISNTGLHRDERAYELPTEAHERVAPARMGDLYRTLDVMLCTSSGPEEGFFLPAVEALACGIPCVMTDVPCFRGYGEGQIALFVPPKDPAAMAEALVIAATHPSVAPMLRSAGIEVAARFTQQRHIEELEKAFAEILAERSRPRAEAQDAQADPRSLSNGNEQRLSRAPSPIFAPGILGKSPDLASGSGREPRRTLTADPQRPPVGQAPSLVADTERVAVRLAELALGYHGQGRLAEAESHLVAALELSGKSAGLLNDLGVVRHQLGDARGARGCFERALELEPYHEDARYNLLATGGA